MTTGIARIGAMAAGVGAAAAGIAFAQQDPQAGLGSAALGPHVHGVAALSFAAEDGTLYVELTSPLANLVGFEHPPQAPAQKTAYREAVASLRAGDFLSFEGTRCRLAEASVREPAWAAPDGEAEAHDHSHHDHGHARSHDEKEEGGAHGEGDGHAHASPGAEEAEPHAAHDQASHDHHGGGHAQISASYRFACDDLDGLRRVSTRLFTLFEGFQEIAVVYLGETAVTATLTPRSAELKLK